MLRSGAEVVVVKAGVDGAFVFEGETQVQIPAYRSETVWTIGSGDVFSATFAAEWAVKHSDAVSAANLASLAVAQFAETQSLPTSPYNVLANENRKPVKNNKGTVYLAGPFFNISQSWLIEEARQALINFGLKVFSPFHDVGYGDANFVAQQDLVGLDRSDVVLAIADGLDPGTLFEIGYAVAKGKLVYVLACDISEDHLTMMRGSGCIIIEDFCTAIHRVVWRS